MNSKSLVYRYPLIVLGSCSLHIEFVWYPFFYLSNCVLFLEVGLFVSFFLLVIHRLLYL